MPPTLWPGGSPRNGSCSRILEMSVRWVRSVKGGAILVQLCNRWYFLGATVDNTCDRTVYHRQDLSPFTRLVGSITIHHYHSPDCNNTTFPPKMKKILFRVSILTLPITSFCQVPVTMCCVMYNRVGKKWVMVSSIKTFAMFIHSLDVVIYEVM